MSVDTAGVAGVFLPEVTAFDGVVLPPTKHTVFGNGGGTCREKEPSITDFSFDTTLPTGFIYCVSKPSTLNSPLGSSRPLATSVIAVAGTGSPSPPIIHSDKERVSQHESNKYELHHHFTCIQVTTLINITDTSSY